MESFLIIHQISIVPAHHTPYWSLVRLKKRAGSGLGHINSIATMLISTNNSQVTNCSLLDVNLWNDESIALPINLFGEIEPGQASHIENIIEISGRDVGGPLDGVNFGLTPNRDLCIINKNAYPIIIEWFTCHLLPW